MTPYVPACFKFFLSACLLIGVSSYAFANTIQVAPTISFTGADDVGEGAVITVDEAQEQYSMSDQAHLNNVFGVTAERPALVFQTGAEEVPVITDGIAFVQVSNTGGEVSRGDFLVTSQIPGVARKATMDESSVFAIALEDYQPQSSSEVGVIQADVSVERAVAALEAQRQARLNTEEEDDPISIVRAAIAAVLVVGGLLFVLYSFRSTIQAGVVSVGRNPRARSSIVALSIGNLTFALVLCVVVVFIAVAVLVLPV